MHRAVLWRADVHTPELILSSHSLLDQFRGLRTNLGEFLSHLGADTLIDLHDLQRSLGNSALGFGDGGDQSATLTVQARCVALAVSRVIWTRCLLHNLQRPVSSRLTNVVSRSFA
ncbi:MULTISPECIES: hypothetical protein [Bradyrhizobium]